MVVEEDAMKILGFVCFLGHFLDVIEWVAPGLKRWARTAVNGGSWVTVGRRRGGLMGRG